MKTEKRYYANGSHCLTLCNGNERFTFAFASDRGNATSPITLMYDIIRPVFDPSSSITKCVESYSFQENKPTDIISLDRVRFIWNTLCKQGWKEESMVF